MDRDNSLVIAVRGDGGGGREYKEYMVMGENKINNMKYGQGRSEIT